MNNLTVSLGSRVQVNCETTDSNLKHHAAQPGIVIGFDYQLGDFRGGEELIRVYLSDDREIVTVAPQCVSLKEK